MTGLRHECARCGRRKPVEQLTYSKFSGRRYCIDIAACERRVSRRKRVREVARSW